MTTITRFTKEQLIAKAQEQIEFIRRTQVTGAGREHVDMCGELFEIALASLEAEAMAYADPQSFDNFKSMGGKNAACTKEWMWRDPANGLIPLYTAPPAPVVPPEKTDRDYVTDCHGVPSLEDCAHQRGWNDCITAMLQGSQPVSNRDELPFDQWLSQQNGKIDVDCGCVTTEAFFHWLRVAYEAGNSPVAPDGWILVSERMPGYQEWVIVFAKWANQQVLCWDDVQSRWTDFEDQSYYADMFSHWMPLPVAPQQEA